MVNNNNNSNMLTCVMEAGTKYWIGWKIRMLKQLSFQAILFHNQLSSHKSYTLPHIYSWIAFKKHIIAFSNHQLLSGSINFSQKASIAFSNYELPSVIINYLKESSIICKNQLQSSIARRKQQLPSVLINYLQDSNEMFLLVWAATLLLSHRLFHEAFKTQL